MKKQTVRSQRMDAMGDRLKAYERIETDKRFRPNSILYVRLDGRSFSKFTKGLNRPYDERLSRLMQETTAYLVDEYNATIGYTQSDEISLILVNDYESPVAFDAKIQKLVSSLAASCTAYFNVNLHRLISEKFNKGALPRFDCRIFEVPNEAEAANAILWREKDAIKNSISMLAQHHFSHNELQNKNSDLMKDMLKTQKNVKWEDQPTFFKSGTYLKRIQYNKKVEGSDEVVLRTKIDKVNFVLNDMWPDERVLNVMSKYGNNLI